VHLDSRDGGKSFGVVRPHVYVTIHINEDNT
jgi:hypothetical protein